MSGETGAPGRPDARSLPLADVPGSAPVTAGEDLFTGRIFDVRAETFTLPSGPVTREFVVHAGAVAVFALDDEDRVLLIRQYRHPVGVSEWEVPAGLLDVAGEPPLEAARRELAEEADLVADEWHVLVDHRSSPGFTDEALRTYLARGIGEVPAAERFQREDEEIDMPTRWVPLEELVDAVLAGAVQNPTLCIGALAAYASRQRGWSTLRPADVPWPGRPARWAGH